MSNRCSLCRQLAHTKASCPHRPSSPVYCGGPARCRVCNPGLVRNPPQTTAAERVASGEASLVALQKKKAEIADAIDTLRDCVNEWRREAEHLSPETPKEPKTDARRSQG